MKDLPVVARFVINIILYIVYVLIASLIFSFLFPIVMQILGQEILDPRNAANAATFAKIQYFIALLVLLISLILRKYFYLCSERKTEVVTVKESYTAKKKITNTEKSSISKELESDEDDIKIYIEKEIK